MGTVLQNIFGKGKGNYGDVEYWHGAERAGWLMKQGVLLRQAPEHAYRECAQQQPVLRTL